MGQRRHHYEQAFESYLRSNRIPYVSVDEARKALIPAGGKLRTITPPDFDGGNPRIRALKSFDFAIYTGSGNFLIDVKGRKISRRLGADGEELRGRMESWVTNDDVESLHAWIELFGGDFAAAFVFLYWCEGQPRDGLFEEIFAFRERWYAVRTVTLADYVRCMRQRSPRWRTVHVPARDFERISHRFVGIDEDAAPSAHGLPFNPLSHPPHPPSHPPSHPPPAMPRPLGRADAGTGGAHGASNGTYHRVG